MTTMVERQDQIVARDDSTTATAHVVTLEQALYIVSVLLAAGIRLWGLARTPLSTIEATNSLAAWWSAMGMEQPLTLVATSPLFFQIQRLIFWVGANGDAAARIVSVAAGTCLVLTPWLFRRIIGRQTALILSLLIAFDPWLAFYSRLADGAILSALLAVAMLGFGVILVLDNGVDEKTRKTSSYLLAVLAGLIVTSGHMAWSFLPILILFAALNYNTLKSAILINYTSGLLFAGAFLLGSTGWLTEPGGIMLISASLTQWVNSVFATGAPTLDAQQVTGYPWTWPLSRLLADQPFIFLFGIGGLLHMTLRRERYPFAGVNWLILLWVWLLWGVFLCAMPGRSPYSLLVIVFPLLFGAAHLTSALIRTVPVGPHDREAVGTLAILFILLVSVVFWITALVASPALDTFMLQAILLLLLLGAALLVFYGIYVSWRLAAWIGLVVLGVALLFVNVGSTWQVNHRADLGRFGGLINETTDIAVWQLMNDVEKYSAQTLGDAHEAQVLIDVASGGELGRLSTEQQTILAWYLRNMRNLTWRMSIPSAAEEGSSAPVLIITPKLNDDMEAPALISEHVGSAYQLRSFEPVVGHTNGENWPADAGDGFGAVADRYWATELRPWLRWLMYREPSVQWYSEEVVLWVPWEAQ